MAPAATRMVVSLALARSRMSRASRRPYLSVPARSAWPGRGRVRVRSAGPSWGSTAMVSAQARWSALRTRRPMGLPKVSPRRTPERISTRSVSMRWRAPLPYPRWRRASWASICAAASGSPAGHPSTMALSAGPWDSPAVKNRMGPPKLEDTTQRAWPSTEPGEGRRHEAEDEHDERSEPQGGLPPREGRAVIQAGRMPQAEDEEHQGGPHQPLGLEDGVGEEERMPRPC